MYGVTKTVSDQLYADIHKRCVFSALN